MATATKIGAWGLFGVTAAALLAVFLPKILVGTVTLNRQGLVQASSKVLSSSSKGDKFVVIVTGSTSGLGYEIAAELYALGAVVIMAARNKDKVTKSIQDIKAEFPGSTGTLDYGLLDTSDLDSVKSFASDFQKRYGKLHALVNNAGIHYGSIEPSPLFHYSTPQRSKQGFDLAFATNYLGHFLLSKLLTPTLSKSGSASFTPKILNIASTYHFQADGTMLDPVNGTPIAADGNVLTFYHRRVSYANNKLAQILHAKELSRRYLSSGVKIKAISVCPGWVRTAILPDNPVGRLVHFNAFPSKAGAQAPLFAIFGEDLQGGEFVTNFKNIIAHQSWADGFFHFLTRIGIRPSVADMMALFVLLTQSYGYSTSYRVEPSSAESRDNKLAADLFDWSEKELKRLGY
jgi:NAD(P)-dependent dehydrogenase (short-subunit alcohol dehydrogenase family)